MIKLHELLGIKYPIIVAPMFLISNVEMVVAALDAGATAAFPALNYRTDKELREAIEQIKSRSNKPFGVNLIVNKSNLKYKQQLKTIAELGVEYVITSLGNPQETIQICKPLGIKVFCDVVDVKYAQKVEKQGADAIIAVNSQAGGHCGPYPKEQLIPMLKDACGIPIISAGGIGNAAQLKSTLQLGVSGVSIGTIFLAAQEANISEDYRNALIEYGEKDIVLTTKLSGSHLTVINTPYVQKMGTDATRFEKFLLKNKRLKKYVKMLIAYKGLKQVENAAQKATYKTVWCAGPAIENIHAIRPLKTILGELTEDLKF